PAPRPAPPVAPPVVPELVPVVVAPTVGLMTTGPLPSDLAPASLRTEPSETHCPTPHFCPGGQMAPAQLSTQRPVWQCCPAGQFTLAQSVGTQRSFTHVKPVPHPLHEQLVQTPSGSLSAPFG